MVSIRDVQLYELNALKDIVSVLDAAGIEYMLAAGTAIGAVRHQGFIPWDDDIDLFMTLKNYKKFLKEGQKLLGDKYFIQNYRTEKHYNEMWTQIRCSGTTSMPKKLKDWDINWGICIDVFPIVGTSSDPNVRRKQERALAFNRLLLSDSYLKASGMAITPKMKLLFLIPRAIRKLICFVNEKRIFLSEDQCDSCTTIWYKLDGIFRKGIFNGVSKIKFEDDSFSIMNNYDEYLTDYYGDYMTLPDESERTGHQGELGEIVFDLNNSYLNYK